VPGLVFSYTEPKTGAVYPQAFLTIDDARVHLAAGLAILGISIYGSEALFAQGRSPILQTQEVYLSSQEIGAMQATFTEQLYELLAARPTYVGATIVT
jgi:hypothetical protein